MYAVRTTHRPIHPGATAASPETALHDRLGGLAELLLSTPAAERSELREQIREAQREMRNAGADDGLLALLLRNMLVDLATAPGRFDASYFAQQLSRAMGRSL